MTNKGKYMFESILTENGISKYTVYVRSLLEGNNKAKSFILTENQGKRKAYITNIGVNTISKRMI